MFIRYILPILALLGFFFAVRIVIVYSRPIIPAQPVSIPSTSPFKDFIAGAGIVEANTENISISTHISGVVTEVFVKAGQLIKIGQPLFKIDDRQSHASLLLEEAEVKVTEAALADSRDQLDIRLRVADKRAMSLDEVNRKRFGVMIKEQELASAKARVDARKIELERLIVRSPIDGTVLQVKIKNGEFAQAGALSNPLIIIGDTEPLHVRCDIDENDAWRVKSSAKAFANLRGNPNVKSELAFVRFEPYVIPKRSLTGESTERVDTRVLQVIYKVSDTSFSPFIGQLVDVYVEENQSTNHG